MATPMPTFATVERPAGASVATAAGGGHPACALIHACRVGSSLKVGDVGGQISSIMPPDVPGGGATEGDVTGTAVPRPGPGGGVGTHGAGIGQLAWAAIH